MVGLKDFEMPSCCNSCSYWSFNRDNEPLCDLTYEYINQFDKRQADCPIVEAISKADYENRLKADMVAMLTDIQLEIEELDTPNNGSAYMDCVEIIQQKINALKENTDEST